MSAKMPSVRVEIDQDQMDVMEPMVQKLDEMFQAGKPGMLLAQIFSGRMQVFVINEEQAKGFARILNIGIKDPRENRESQP